MRTMKSLYRCNRSAGMVPIRRCLHDLIRTTQTARTTRSRAGPASQSENRSSSPPSSSTSSAIFRNGSDADYQIDRSVFLRVHPRPEKISDTRAILKKLEEFGPVVMFRSARVCIVFYAFRLYYLSLSSFFFFFFGGPSGSHRLVGSSSEGMVSFPSMYLFTWVDTTLTIYWIRVSQTYFRIVLCLLSDRTADDSMIHSGFFFRGSGGSVFATISINRR